MSTAQNPVCLYRSQLTVLETGAEVEVVAWMDAAEVVSAAIEGEDSSKMTAAEDKSFPALSMAVLSSRSAVHERRDIRRGRVDLNVRCEGERLQTQPSGRLRRHISALCQPVTVLGAADEELLVRFGVAIL